MSLENEHIPLMTVDDLANRWKKPAQWIYTNWRSIGLTPIAVGRQLRFRPADIQKWEQQQVIGNPASNKGEQND